MRRRRHLGTDCYPRRARADTEGVTATFICANAQTYPFEPESFDLIVSRFGVMVLRRIRSRHSRTCGAPRATSASGE
jgi:hypothetical protein